MEKVRIALRDRIWQDLSDGRTFSEDVIKIDGWAVWFEIDCHEVLIECGHANCSDDRYLCGLYIERPADEFSSLCEKRLADIWHDTRFDWQQDCNRQEREYQEEERQMWQQSYGMFYRKY